MSAERLKVVVTRRLPEPVEDRLQELYDVSLNAEDHPFTEDQLLAAMQSADVLVPTITDHIDAKLLDHAAPSLKMIANYGAGFDHIDVAAALRKDILVTNTPDVVTEDTADMTLALILGVTRRVGEGRNIMQSGEWSGWSPMAMLGARLGGRKLGILGMGRIGQAVARRARAFGLEIHYHNRNQLREEIEADLGATYWSSLDQMVSNVDILSINCPHTPATFHLMNERRLKLMKPSATVINTSRGEVVDTLALTRMLRSGEIAGAGLDVYEDGDKVNPRLRNLDNAVLLPHMGSATVEGRIEMGEKVLINIQTFADGHRPPNQVLPSML